MRMNQANRISSNQYHLGRRMNYVPGEEYFSCIVLRRTGIGPFDFGWWASSSWNDLETWKSSISKSTAGAIFCYFANKGLVNLSWKTGRTFALAPPCGRESWHGNRAGPAESHIQTELGVRVLLLCSTVPRSTANESNLSTHTFLSLSTSVQLSSFQTQRSRKLHLVPKVRRVSSPADVGISIFGTGRYLCRGGWYRR